VVPPNLKELIQKQKPAAEKLLDKKNHGVNSGNLSSHCRQF